MAVDRFYLPIHARPVFEFLQNNGELENRRQFTKGFFVGDIWRHLLAADREFWHAFYEPYRILFRYKGSRPDVRHQNYVWGSGPNLPERPCRSSVSRRRRSRRGTIGKSVTKPDYNNWLHALA